MIRGQEVWDEGEHRDLGLCALPVPSPGHVGMQRSPASQETSQLYLNRKKEVFSVIQCPRSMLFIEQGSTWHPGSLGLGRWRTGALAAADLGSIEQCRAWVHGGEYSL